MSIDSWQLALARNEMESGFKSGTLKPKPTSL